jgi:hypothetical protein
MLIFKRKKGLKPKFSFSNLKIEIKGKIKLKVIKIKEIIKI